MNFAFARLAKLNQSSLLPPNKCFPNQKSGSVEYSTKHAPIVQLLPRWISLFRLEKCDPVINMHLQQVFFWPELKKNPWIQYLKTILAKKLNEMVAFFRWPKELAKPILIFDIETLYLPLFTIQTKKM